MLNIPNRRGVWVREAAKAAAALVASVLLGAAAINVYYANKIDFRIEGDWLAEGDETIGYTAAKKINSLVRHPKRRLQYHVYTDERGARVNGPGESTGHRVDVVTIGGSFAWGHGVENEQTFTQLLKKQLSVDVSNLAFAGYGTLHSLQSLQKNIDLKPKVIIYTFIYQHMARNLSPYAPSKLPIVTYQSYVKVAPDGGVSVHSPRGAYDKELQESYYREIVESGRPTLSYVLWGGRTITAAVKIQVLGNYADNYDVRKDSMGILMKEMTNAARNCGAALAVVHIPSLEKGSTSMAPSELLDSLREDVLFVDMSETVLKHYADQEAASLMLENDGHPNPWMHQLVARELAGKIAEASIF